MPESSPLGPWPKPALWISGECRAARDGRTFSVKNPATGEVLAEVPLASTADTQDAVEAARKALPAWRGMTADQRAQILNRLYQLLLEHKDALARLTTLENGAPLATTSAHAAYGAGFFRWFAEESKRLYGRSIPHPDPKRRLRVEYYPVGVVGAITPWNFPFAAPAKKVAGALAAGCTVVLKPSELTPLSAFAMAFLAAQAGVPAGVFNVVYGDAQAIGRVMLDHPEVRLISFTGSTRIGRYLMTEAGKQIKRVALELGGNAPFLVFADADLDQAADDLVFLKSMNCGQVCVTANRVLVEKSIQAPFVQRVVERLKRLRVGNGLDPQVTMGPLIHAEARQRVAALVEEAKAQGARVLCGGITPSQDQGSFYPPTLLENVKPTMRLVNEEIFGPVAPVIPFEDEAEAIRMANDTPYGLAAYAYTRDPARAQRLADNLEAGMVGINDPRPVIPEAPFGGIKQSGIGREGGQEGLLEFMDCRLIGMRFS